MKWIAVTGSWRKTNAQMETDIRSSVKSLLDDDNGVVVGGALGADYIATDEALSHARGAQAVKIILPTSLSVYSEHFNARARENVITQEQACNLIAQLTLVKQQAPENFIEMEFNACNPETYYARNSKVIDEGQELIAFHVNATGGVQDAIDKGRLAGKKLTIFTYQI